MILLVLIALLLYTAFYHFYWKRRNLPPGPTPLPVAGNLLSLYFYEPGYEAFRIWEQKYGPCFTFWMVNKPAIVVTDFELLKETVVKDGASYTGRLENPFSRVVRGGDYGIIEVTGALWQQQRRFVLHVLRDFGMGKNLMEERLVDQDWYSNIYSQTDVSAVSPSSESEKVKPHQPFINGFEKAEQSQILAEVTDLLRKCDKFVEKELDLRDFIDTAVGSVINSLLFGFRFDESNTDIFLHRKAVVKQMMELSARPAFILWMFYPWLSYLPWYWKYDRETKKMKTILYDLFDSQIETHKAKIDFDSEGSTDYVEAFLKEQKLHENEPEFGGFSNDQLRNMCFDLWMAGMETTANTLYWGVCYVLQDSEVQKRIHEEMDKGIGTDRLITIADKNRLHYMNAVISEVQRLANLLPVNVFRETTTEVTIQGYRLPPRTLFLPQISTVMYNEKFFPDPYKFDPTRHLDSDGNFVKIEQVVPFSMGKRQCAGEGLARMELFLFFANLFNKYEISPYQGKLPSTKKSFGGTVRAEDFSVTLRNRHIKLM